MPKKYDIIDLKLLYLTIIFLFQEETPMLNKGKNKVNASFADHINAVDECLIKFESFMETALVPSTPNETLKALAKTVMDAEDVADKALRAMIDSLGGKFLPSTQENLISIGTSCDSVANKCENVAKMIVAQKFKFPFDCSEDIKKVIKISGQQFELLETSIERLLTSFGDLLKDHSILDEIRALETQVDVIEDALTEKIFDTDLSLAEKTQFALIVDYICDVSDIIENIADKIQIMLITRKA